jgi:hypothetical protein
VLANEHVERRSKVASDASLVMTPKDKYETSEKVLHS